MSEETKITEALRPRFGDVKVKLTRAADGGISGAEVVAAGGLDALQMAHLLAAAGNMIEGIAGHEVAVTVRQT